MKGTFSPRGARRGAGYGNEVPRWEARTLINSLWDGEAMAIVYARVDLAKNVFAVHGVDRVTPPCMIAMEAGSGAHTHTRSFTATARCTPSRPGTSRVACA